mgnify:CR=1 FL=1
MPKFGKRSRERLRGVDAKLVNVLNEVCKYFDITVIEGLRSQFKGKRTTKDNNFDDLVHFELLD